MLPSPPLAAVVLPITDGSPPLHIVSPVVVIAPAVNCGRTVTVAIALFADAQTPLCTTALYSVVVVKLV